MDHPSFGAAVGRTLQAAGFKVAIVPQPNWRDDLRDFRKLGRPRLFFGVSAGAMDSMVNQYTANRRLRHDDAYTPGKHGMRGLPRRSIPAFLKSCSRCAGHRRRDRGSPTRGALRLLGEPAKAFDHSDAKADMIVYGMGERTVADLARRLDAGEQIADITDMPQTLFISKESPGGRHRAPFIQKCLADKNFRHSISARKLEESNKYAGAVIWQEGKRKMVKIQPYAPAYEYREKSMPRLTFPTPGCLIHATEDTIPHTK